MIIKIRRVDGKIKEFDLPMDGLELNLEVAKFIQDSETYYKDKSCGLIKDYNGERYSGVDTIDDVNLLAQEALDFLGDKELFEELLNVYPLPELHYIIDNIVRLEIIEGNLLDIDSRVVEIFLNKIKEREIEKMKVYVFYGEEGMTTILADEYGQAKEMAEEEITSPILWSETEVPDTPTVLSTYKD